MEERKDNFAEVETGFNPAEAQKEAGRCLSCRRCLGCGLCLAVCEPKAIVFDQEDEVLDLTVDDIIISPEAGMHMPLVKGEFGYREYTNVVTAFEFERILDEDGPYGGLIIRPFDGEIPEKMAFILAFNHKRNNTRQEAYKLISSALKEAKSALEKVEDLQITIFFHQGIEMETLSALEKIKGITIRIGNVIYTEEIKETGNLLVTFMEEDEKKEEAFEMLVISKRPEICQEIRKLAREIG